MSPSTIPVLEQRLHGAARHSDELSDTPCSPGFLALIRGFFASGGTARSEELARLIDERYAGGQLCLAKLLASEHVFVFEWRHALWIPMFQLDPHDLSPHPSMRELLAVLSPVLSGWQLATWFARPHPKLDHGRPADVLTRDAPAVLAAAHATRFEHARPRLVQQNLRSSSQHADFDLTPHR